jgi:LEA14-like dessication related protein
MSRMVIAIVCVTALLGGCSANLRQVSTRVDSVRVDELTDQGVRVLVTLVAENPNNIPLPIVKAKYKVTLAGISGGGGEFTFTDLPKATLPAHGTQTITLPAAFALNGGNAVGVSYKVAGQLTYEPPGEIRKLLTEYNVPLPSASFKDEGRLP